MNLLDDGERIVPVKVDINLRFSSFIQNNRHRRGVRGIFRHLQLCLGNIAELGIDFDSLGVSAKSTGEKHYCRLKEVKFNCASHVAVVI